MESPLHTPQRIPVGGVELEVFEAGRGNPGGLVVLLHGWPDHAHTWRHQVPALVDAGFHVLVPNQRGYGGSSRPDAVEAFALEELCADLVGLLDHVGQARATFIGHDWGATVAWGLALLHPDRVQRLVALSVPYQVRTPQPWVAFLEGLLGPDHYMVDFNRRPGAADAVLEANTARFLGNLYRTGAPPQAPPPGNLMAQLALAEEAPGDPILDEADMARLVAAFETSGFRSSIHWYRNLDRNWHRLADVDPIVRVPALMVYGRQDPVAQFPGLRDFVPAVEVVELDCGHWIQQERPAETTRAILGFLARTAPA